MIVVGIDPGLNGGLAVISEDHCAALPMMTIGKELDVPGIVWWLRFHKPDLVVVEQVHSMPKQGVVSTFRFGVGLGVLIGIVGTMELPLRLVTPQAWKKVVLEGTARDKDAAIQHVRRAYPGIDLTPGRLRKPHDGIADAVCLAEWGRRVGK